MDLIKMHYVVGVKSPPHRSMPHIAWSLPALAENLEHSAVTD